ncbi:MAG TPA: MJ0042-type zinc finger domain-containing protein [Pseudolabrys sp.]|nr:MJ0042-type zinc finger domain-containing protein [Pseudolabrys sp.]
MLIVCPSCATSYMIDQASLGAAGRNVRCARCKASWFAGGPEPTPEPVAVAEPVAAEAQAQPTRAARAAAVETPPPPAEPAPPLVEAEPPAAAGADVPALQPEPTPAPEAEAPPAPPEPETTAPPEAPASPPAELPAAPEPVAEAEPATITDAPPLVPPIEHEPEATEADSEDAASFDTRRRVLQARRKQSRRSSRWTAVILVLIACNVAVVGARNEVVRYLPQTASLFAAIGLPVNLRNLKFENVKLSSEDAGGITMLTVQGSIVSEAGKPVGVPRLRFAVRNATGQEVYTWTMAPPRSILEPGAKAEFHSQIPVPKVDATDVMVRFLTAQDAVGK